MNEVGLREIDTVDGAQPSQEPQADTGSAVPGSFEPEATVVEPDVTAMAEPSSSVAGAPEPSEAQPHVNKDIGSLAPWQQFIEKRTEKRSEAFTKQADTQPENTSATSVEDPVTTESVDFNTVTEEVLVDNLTQVRGIGEKTALYLVSQVVELRELGVSFESAADFKANLWGIGTKKANEMAKYFNLPEIESEESPETPEQEAADQADLQQRVEGWLGGAQRAVEDIKGRVFSIFQKTGTISMDGLSQVTAGTKAARGYLRDATDVSQGLSVMEGVVNQGIAKMEKPWEYPENSEPEVALPERSTGVRGFLEKLPQLKLSAKQQELVRWVGLATSTAVLTTALLVSARHFTQEDTTKVIDVLSPVVSVSASDVLRQPYDPEAVATADVLRAVPAQTVSPTADVLREVPDPTVPAAEVLREDTDRSSAPGQELARDNYETVITAPVDGLLPPVGPVVTPDAATAFTPPPTPDMGSTITPDAATAYQAPEVTPADTTSIADITAVPPASATVSPENMPDTLGSRWLDQKAPSTNPATIEPVSFDGSGVATTPEGQAPSTEQPPAPEVEQSELSTLDEGILDTECVKFARALSEKLGIAYNADAKNVCKLVIKFMNHHNNIDWNNQQAGVVLTKINSVAELGKQPDQGEIGIVPPDEVMSSIYLSALNRESMAEGELKAVLEGMMSYQVTEDTMTDEQLRLVIEHGFNNPVEPPEKY